MIDYALNDGHGFPEPDDQPESEDDFGLDGRRLGQTWASRTPSPRKRIRLSTARRCLFVTSEMADFLKAGGLGDVSAALPRALRRSQDVRVLIPGYPAVLAQARSLEIVGHVAPVASLPSCDIARIEQVDGLVIYAVLCAQLYDRPGSPYVGEDGEEYPDNAVRFATLAHAAAEIAAGRAGMQWRPHLLHLNDWPCALAAGYVRWRGIGTPVLLTIHNLAYQGLFATSMARSLDIPVAGLGDMDFYGRLSFLQAGIVNATHVNTVSVSYASQITGPEQGCGLDGLLSARAERGSLTGIVNGIDASWDASNDRHLHTHYDVGEWEGKRANAAQVRREFGLMQSTGPLFAVVSRLVHQKGLDLTCDVAPQIVAAGGQIVVIGEGERALEQVVAQLARRFPGHVAAHVGFSETVARRMFAGSDFLLMPSRFEPCGLSQMYAQRFGSLPIAHATGGLIDTIDDGVTGFLFDDPTADGLRRCLQRAFRVFHNPLLLNAMRSAAMLTPRGWDVASHKYEALYERAAPLAVA